VRFGDVWTPSIYPYTWPSASDGVQVTRAELPALLAEAAEARAAAGRAPLECIPSAGMPLEFTDRPAHAGRSSDEVLQFSSRGTPEEIGEEFRLFQEAGCEGFVVRIGGNAPEEFVTTAQRFADEVMPQLKG
jgi:hypothetical protein